MGRPPQNGRRTLDKEFSLDSLVKKNGGIPDICNAVTEHTRNFRPNWDNRSSVSSYDYRNPIVKNPKPNFITNTLEQLQEPVKTSYLAAEGGLAGGKVFPDRHIPFTQMFRKQVKIRKPKDHD